MPALKFARETLLDPRSPACWWRHPRQAGKIVLGAAENALLTAWERGAGGRARSCPVCGWRGSRFRNFLSADEIIRGCICPACGSFDRHRLLVLGIRRELQSGAAGAPGTIVGFSLSTAVRFHLEHEGLARCFRCDYDYRDPRFAPDFAADLRRAPLGDGSVDWIFCSHVLEHVPELDVCVDELLRILRPGGAAWLQIPLEPGVTHSRSIPVDPYRAHAHAWQFGPDFGHLIERRGWEVTEVVAADFLSSQDIRNFGVDPAERYWVCRKNKV